MSLLVAIPGFGNIAFTCESDAERLLYNSEYRIWACAPDLTEAALVQAHHEARMQVRRMRRDLIVVRDEQDAEYPFA